MKNLLVHFFFPFPYYMRARARKGDAVPKNLSPLLNTK